MHRKCLCCFLALLLTSAALDDAWAAGTPDPADDAQAAEDNEYPQAAPDREGRPLGAADEGLGGAMAPPAALPVSPAPEPFLTVAPHRPALGRSFLYTLMSLRC